MVGVLFGFFGMSGSFLVTPALLVLGFEPTVAVGSGMAFVFGTAAIAIPNTAASGRWTTDS